MPNSSLNSSLNPSFTLDLRGESCPYPLIYTLESLENMSSGELLQIITDCPSSFRNIPEEMDRRGYRSAIEPIRNGQEFLFYVYA